MVAQGLGERLRLAQIGEEAVTLSPLPEGERRPKRMSMACSCGATLGEMRQGDQRLLEARHRLPTGRACQRLVARLVAVGHGLVPHLAPQGMVGQPFHLVGEPVGIALFDSRDDTAMQQALPLAQQPPIGHLVRQGVLEGIVALGKQAGFVEELGGLQVRQATVQRFLRLVGDGLQQRPGHLRADHRSGLEQALLLRGQPVDARGQHRLHRGGDLQALQRPGQPIGTALADQDPGLHQGAHALFQKERVTPGACDQEWCECRKAGVVPQQGLEECIRARRRQRVEPELGVVGLAAPAMLVLRAVIDQQ